MSARLCEGCGLPLIGKRRHAKSHNATCRSRKYRREHPRELEWCSQCVKPVSRLDDVTGWCPTCTRQEAAVAA